MGEGAIVELICTQETFRPAAHGGVRWLDVEADFPLIVESAVARGLPAPSRDDWREWHAAGYRYAALVDDGKIIAMAAAWNYSEGAWELAAVSTREEFRGRGCAKAVCSFVTSWILGRQPRAPCHTRADNAAMLRVAENLGFQRSSPHAS
jgi:RimJ/RimL family protein N-acetyltransferase